MRMKEVRKLSQTTIDEIVINCQSLFDNTANVFTLVFVRILLRQEMIAQENEESFLRTRNKISARKVHVSSTGKDNYHKSII